MVKISRKILFFVLFVLGAVSVSATQVVFNYCPIILNASTEAIMTQSISNNGSPNRFACVHIAGDNVVLDCNGTTIEYGFQPTNATTDNIGANISDGAAINVSNVVNVNITGCRLNDVNATGGTPVGGQATGAINVTNVRNLVINNTIIRTNGTNHSDGIVLWNTSNVTLQNLTIFVQSNNGSGSYGIFAHLNFTNLAILHSAIFTNGTVGNNSAIVLWGQGSNVTIYNNSITANGTGSDNYGILVNGSNTCSPGACITAVSNGNVSNNTVFTIGTGNNTAIRFERGAVNSSIVNNRLFPNGSNGNNYGVLLNTSSGINITGNQITPYGFSFNIGVFLQLFANNNNVSNNTINTFLSKDRNNSGVVLLAMSSNNSVRENWISTSGSHNNTGVSLVQSSQNNTVLNNTINTNGTQGGNFGILLFGQSSGNLLRGNWVNTSGTSFDDAIRLDTIINGTNVYNNTLLSYGNESFNHGLHLITGASINNSFENNTIMANGNNVNSLNNGSNQSDGIRLETSVYNNTFSSNNITVIVQNSYAIFLSSAADNQFWNTSMNTTTNLTNWMFQNDGNYNNFTNTTFRTGNGSIRYTSNFTMNLTNNVTTSRMNISYNRTFVNSTLLPFLNTSARITLLGLQTFGNPEPYFDSLDTTAAFAKCDSTVCTEISFAPTEGTYVFDVTHFSAYSALEGTVFGGGGSSSARSSGGGGSGVSSSSVSMTTQSLTTAGLHINQKVSFSVNSVQHTMTVIGVSQDTVTVRLASTPQTFVLHKASVQEVDLDGDLVPDFRITVNDIYQSAASFKLEKLQNKVIKAVAMPAAKPVASPTPAAAPAPVAAPKTADSAPKAAPVSLPTPKATPVSDLAPVQGSSAKVAVAVLLIVVVLGGIGYFLLRSPR